MSTVHLVFYFFFNDTATTEIYTLSLHDALPIWILLSPTLLGLDPNARAPFELKVVDQADPDRKSTRLNSSHVEISYAVFCLKKKKKTTIVASDIKTKKKNDIDSR